MIQKKITVLILAAGLGTRLSPLTDNKPKALIEFRKKPMIQHVIESLTQQGVKRIVVNVHHHADQLATFLKNYTASNVEILISDERNQLMDTGGGIIKAENLLPGQEPFIVHNTDILSNIDLNALYDFNNQSNVLATLAVKKREANRVLMFDENGDLSGWRNKETGEKILVEGKKQVRSFPFSGIHVIDPLIFKLITIKSPFSIMHAYLELAVKYRITFYDHSFGEWIDMAAKYHYPELD